ncbi:MAG: hypothetical protein HQ579_05000 [Candidatus Omnitrophica bacterium]|nr:hypothetical protein [Candidatus Omnitrophota bacterium]
MIDKKLEDNIKNTKRFLEFWSKFHEMHTELITGSAVLPKRQEDFRSTRTLVNSRFQDLMEFVGINQAERVTKAIPLYEILSIENTSDISDEKIARIEDYWTDSYIYLSFILGRLQKKKKRIERFNKFFFMAKNFFRHVNGRRTE